MSCSVASRGRSSSGSSGSAPAEARGPRGSSARRGSPSARRRGGAADRSHAARSRRAAAGRRSLARRVMHPVGQAHLRERGHRPLPAFARGEPPVLERELDVLERGGARQEVEPLEDEPDETVADEEIARPSFVRAPTSSPARCVGPARRPVQTAQMSSGSNLPDPLVPTMATNSPRSMVRSTSRSACTVPAALT